MLVNNPDKIAYCIFKVIPWQVVQTLSKKINYMDICFMMKMKDHSSCSQVETVLIHY